MNITSVMRATGSAVLVTAFAFAPMLPLSEAIQTSRIISVPVAEAAAISYGTISGTVRLGDKLDVTNKVAPGVTVNLYLNQSNSLNSSTVTDSNGFFSFSVLEGVDYRVEIVPAIGYGIPVGATAVENVKSLTNSVSLTNFTLVKLPAVKMFGPAVVTVTQGGVYNDPGVIFQKEDGTVVPGFGIDAIGSVNTNVAGQYTIKYHVDSKATNGYPTIDAVRTVNVVLNPSVAPVKASLVVLPSKSTTPAISIKDTDVVSSCVFIHSYLGKSFSNDKLEVLKLQAFLFFKEGFVNVKATGVYDAATELAVRNFQDRYFKDVLTPWGTEDNTGEVRLTTQKKINDIFCGVNTSFNKAQESTFLAYKLEAASKKVSLNISDTPLVLETKDSKSFVGKISSWWNNTKKNLIAVLPGFGKKETSSEEVATNTASVKAEGTSAVKDDTKNLASATESKANSMSTVATIISLILGIAAFLFSIYLYRKTRGPVMVIAEPEITHVEVKK